MRIIITLLSATILFFNSSDAQIITFDKTYGSLADEEGNAVIQTWDGGYIMGDSKNLIKTSDSGVVEWSKPIPASAVNITSDSGYILLHNNGDIDFTRVDQQGNTIWTTTYGQGLWAREAYSIEETSDGGYIVGGRFQDFSGSGMMLLKLNATGGVSWRKTFSEPTSAAFCYGRTVRQTLDGGYLLAGHTYINYYDSTQHKDVYIVKTDSAGTLQWKKHHGSTANEHGFNLQFTADGNYIMAGSQYDSTSAKTNMYLLKMNSLGDSIWSKSYSGINYSEARAVWQTNDGGYIMAGRNFTDLWKEEDIIVRKVDSLGNSQWTKEFGGNHDDRANDIQQTFDGGFIITGRTESKGAGAEDAFLLKLNAAGEVVIPTSISETELESAFKLYPNPTNGMLKVATTLSDVNIRVYSLDGREVLSQMLQVGENGISLEAMSKGTYVYELIHELVTVGQGKLTLK